MKRTSLHTAYIDVPVPDGLLVTLNTDQRQDGPLVLHIEAKASEMDAAEMVMARLLDNFIHEMATK